MKLFKRIFIPTTEKKELTAYESWAVRWTARYGKYMTDTKEVAEFFTSEDDAKAFAQQLKDAFSLIKHTSGTSVKIEKQ